MEKLGEDTGLLTGDGMVMEKLGEDTGLLTGDGMVVVGHSRFAQLHTQYGVLCQVSHRQYGDNVVEFYQRASKEW
jgi:hypothetical protein